MQFFIIPQNIYFSKSFMKVIINTSIVFNFTDGNEYERERFNN